MENLLDSESSSPELPKRISVTKKERNSTMQSIRDSFKKEGSNARSRSQMKARKGSQFRSTFVNQTEETFDKKYTIIQTIGQGASGIVKKVKRKEDGKIFCVKIIRIRDAEHFDLVTQEFKLCKDLNHPNIVQNEELIANQLDNKAFLVLEYCDGQSLEDIIQENGSIPESEMRGIVAQLLEAIKYLHENLICHRDVKPDNIIITSKKQVKVIDFSVSTKFSKKNQKRKTSSDDTYEKYKFEGMMLTNTGTNEYKAPEMVLGAPYTKSIDMWAVGVLVYYALIGEKPFQNQYLSDLYEKISEAKIIFGKRKGKSITGEAKTFIGGCLTKTTFMRMTAEEGANHPWIKGWGMVGRCFSDVSAFFDKGTPTTLDKKGKRSKSPLSLKRKISNNYKLIQDLQENFSGLPGMDSPDDSDSKVGSRIFSFETIKSETNIQ